MNTSTPKLPNCLCPGGYCLREYGELALKDKSFMCRDKIIVPRHEPTIDRDKLIGIADGWAWHCWKDKMEPIETEQPEYEY